jgi:hypothetical protein
MKLVGFEAGEITPPDDSDVTHGSMESVPAAWSSDA